MILTEEQILKGLETSDAFASELVFKVYGIRKPRDKGDMEAMKVKECLLADGANKAQCTKLAYIKELVRIFNIGNAEAHLTLTIETKETYSG